MVEKSPTGLIMRRLPKIVLEQLKRKSIGDQPNRQSTIEDRQFLHPDANLLAAFVERTLSERERRQVLNHLAQCAECREIVALTLPEEVKVAEAMHSPARWRWRIWPRLRWSALAAALGAVVIAMVLSPHTWRKQEIAARHAGTETKQPATLMATARPPATVETQNIPIESKARTVSKSRGEMPPGVVPAAPRLARPANKTSAASEGAPEAAVKLEAQADATAAPVKTESVAISKGVSGGVVGGIIAGRSTPPALGTAVPVRVESKQANLPSMAFREVAAGAIAQPAALWTISSSGKVRRSDDGGKTWEEVRIDDKVTFRVIQAVGKEVWAGGSGGALFHSSDGGVIWTRANLSSGGSPTMETIVAIVSSSRNPQSITVRAASGEQWTTEDGGQHWQWQPFSQ